MKYLPLTFSLLLLSSSLFADPGLEPNDYYFLTGSPHNKFYAVQTIRDWFTPSDSSKVTFKARLQVFNTSDGALVWQSEPSGFLGSDFYLTDDGDHYVIIKSSLPLSPKPETPVIIFYNRDKKIREVPLSELKVSPEFLGKSTSSSHLFDVSHPERKWSWEKDSQAMGLDTATPRFSKNTMTVSLPNKAAASFDFTTGRLIGINSY